MAGDLDFTEDSTITVCLGSSALGITKGSCSDIVWETQVQYRRQCENTV